MKKFICLLLVIVITFSFSACSGGKQAAFTSAQTTYNNLISAYEKIDVIGSEIYEAWRIAIYDTPSLEKLDGKLELTNEELVAAALSLGAYSDYPNSVFYIFGDANKFSIAITVVKEAYELKGTYDEIETLLNSAKNEMKTMSDKYSDYEHYNNLKNMYSIVDSYADFCEEPSGSFEQLKTTMNDYRNDFRDLESDLAFFFE